MESNKSYFTLTLSLHFLFLSFSPSVSCLLFPLIDFCHRIFDYGKKDKLALEWTYIG